MYLKRRGNSTFVTIDSHERFHHWHFVNTDVLSPRTFYCYGQCVMGRFVSLDVFWQMFCHWSICRWIKIFTLLLVTHTFLTFKTFAVDSTQQALSIFLLRVPLSQGESFVVFLMYSVLSTVSPCCEQLVRSWLMTLHSKYRESLFPVINDAGSLLPTMNDAGSL